MAPENVEIVRRTFAAYDAGDIEGMFAYTDPEIVIYRADPDGRTFHGPEGFLQALMEWVEPFAEFRATLGEVIDAGDKAVACVRQEAVGEQSRARIEADFWFVYTFGDGKVTRLDMFAGKAPALAAAGLSA
jgi:ketosteroid isomerase-like protein